jgi:putative endonuclease
MYFVYILYSEKNDRYYVGHTANIEQRLLEHNSGLNFSTKPFIPWILLGFVAKETKSQATILELKVKNLNKQRKLAFIEKYCSNNG